MTGLLIRSQQGILHVAEKTKGSSSLPNWRRSRSLAHPASRPKQRPRREPSASCAPAPSSYHTGRTSVGISARSLWVTPRRTGDWLRVPLTKCDGTRPKPLMAARTERSLTTPSTTSAFCAGEESQFSVSRRRRLVRFRLADHRLATLHEAVLRCSDRASGSLSLCRCRFRRGLTLTEGTHGS